MDKELRLRTLEKDDLEFLHKLNNNPDVMDYWFAEAHISLEQVRNRFENNLENEQHRQFILWHNEKRIGFIGLFRIQQRHRNAEFAIMIDPEHQGNGYAEPATRLAMDYAFKTLNLHKLYLHADKINEKAIHIYEKVGFRTEGELREHVYVNGEYHNLITMSVFK
ncbi:GNAT family N-acetyltransferase [Lentibacillus lipolyticus]|nr:GNAT family N-acetyltransferase [Lentibacillus lipolyticus]